MPTTPAGSYDVRAVIGDVVDDGDFLELRAGWSPNLVTGMASLGGHAVGIVANQTQSLAGSIDIPASQKGARFVSMCDAFLLLGGGAQSQRESIAAHEQRKPVTVIQGFGGVADELGPEDLSRARFLKKPIHP